MVTIERVRKNRWGTGELPHCGVKITSDFSYTLAGGFRDLVDVLDDAEIVFGTARSNMGEMSGGTGHIRLLYRGDLVGCIGMPPTGRQCRAYLIYGAYISALNDSCEVKE